MAIDRRHLREADRPLVATAFAERRVDAVRGSDESFWSAAVVLAEAQHSLDPPGVDLSRLVVR